MGTRVSRYSFFHYSAKERLPRIFLEQKIWAKKRLQLKKKSYKCSHETENEANRLEHKLSVQSEQHINKTSKPMNICDFKFETMRRV